MLKFVRQLSGVVGRGSKAISKKFGYPRLTKDEVKLLSSLDMKYPNGPVCYFEFGKNDLRRTLYTFFKFFDLAGCNLIVEPNNALFAEMKGDIYGRWVIEEQLIKIGVKPENPDGCFSLVNKKGMTLVSDNYFMFDEHDYYFPITQHPGMYQLGYWNKPVGLPADQRVQQIFFAGNFNINTYRRIKKDGLFDVIIRTDLLQYLWENDEVYLINSSEQIGQQQDLRKVIIADTGNFEIPMKDLRQTLGKYNFFLAAPGASVPHSHNMAEALSVGCIPVIQDTYAHMIHPPLEHGKNALIFKDLNSLSKVIAEAGNLSKNQVTQMSHSVSDYYQLFMTPKAVIDRILDPAVNRVKVLSFSSSINYLKRK
ncbi:MAG: hypothetical protein RIC35_24495 [Marinoscillum sp.]